MNYCQNYLEPPVILELKKRLNGCRNELLKLLDDWHYFQNVLHSQIMFTYETIFGELEYELHLKSRIASELERRLELLSIKLQRGEKLNNKTFNFINRIVNNEFKRLDNQFEEDIQYSNDNSNYIYKNSKQEKAIPTLYRKIVWKLHPDVAGNTDLFQKYWDNVQDAYKSKNYHRLNLFYKILYSNTEQEIVNSQTEEYILRTEIRELEKNIDIEKHKIANLMEQEPFIFVDKLDDEIWVARRKRKLLNKLFQIDRQIRYNEVKLKSLVSKDINQLKSFSFSESKYKQSEYASSS
jgi:hypothetical protein